MVRTPRIRPTQEALPGLTEVVHVARGASGDVLRAREPGMGRAVAVKVYTAVHGSACAEREVAVAGLLGVHPHLVTIHRHGRTPHGHAYVVMPWYEGGSLADVVRDRGPMPVTEALGLGVRLAGALAHLHGHGVVHRDVKPANVLLTGTGEPVLADLGLATLPGEPPAPAAGLTPLHAAPEVLRGEPATPASDVWSLVSTLCTITDRSDLPAALTDLVREATSADPHRRPQTGADLVTRLQQVQRQLGLQVTQVPTAPTRPALPRPTSPPHPAAPPSLSGPLPPTTPQPSALPQPPAVPPSPAGSDSGGLSGQVRPGAPSGQGPPGGDETVLRDPPSRTRQNPWPGIVAGALAGTTLAVLLLTLVSLLHPW
jgi:serine/threonine-protein kinase PknK